MADRIFAAVWLACTVAYAYAARDYVAPYSYEPIGPRAFPMLLAAISAVCSAWLLIRPARFAETLHGLPPGGVPKAAVLGFALIGYGVVFEWLGFPLATLLVTLVIGRLFGGGWSRILVAGTGLGVGLYVLFDRLLDVTVPLGSLWSF